MEPNCELHQINKRETNEARRENKSPGRIDFMPSLLVFLLSSSLRRHCQEMAASVSLSFQPNSGPLQMQMQIQTQRALFLAEQQPDFPRYLCRQSVASWLLLL